MYVSKEQIEQARNTDMVQFLERREGMTIKRSGHQYRCELHDSLVVMEDRKGWYWNSKAVGGNNAIAFCMKVYGCSFIEAVELLSDSSLLSKNSKHTASVPIRKQPISEERRKLILPEQDHLSNGQRNYRNIIAYLCKTRGIDYGIVNQLIYDKRIYQGIGYSGLVLIGYDSENKAYYRYKGDKPEYAPDYVTVELRAQKQHRDVYICEGFSADKISELMKLDTSIKKYVNMIAVSGSAKQIDYAFCRSVSTNSTYRIDLPGSSKEHSFTLGNGGSQLYVFESVIDMLSFATLQNRKTGNPDEWGKLTMLSLAGKSDLALENYLSEHSNINEIVFCLDNDEAGINASKELSDKYAIKGYAVSTALPRFKDYNDELCHIISDEAAAQTTNKLTNNKKGISI